jgi:uncharacterized cupin superfamily protein
MVAEAPLERTEHGLVPAGEGWFVLNARETRWLESDEMGVFTPFESEDARFQELGFNIAILQPGQRNCMYHGEEAQEDFLVLSGECLLIVEGQERQLRAWDLVHCPPWTEHVLLGAGDGPCVLLGVGARKQGRGLVYPVNETALKHGAGVEKETADPREAYAAFKGDTPVSCPADFPA